MKTIFGDIISISIFLGTPKSGIPYGVPINVPGDGISSE
jgi:hypothetical protein